MKEVILIKLGEIVLKGLNRGTFESVLLRNIRRRLSKNGEFEITSMQSTIYVVPRTPQADMDEACDKIKKIFGVISYTRACCAPKNLEEIQAAAAAYLAGQLGGVKTFKVETKRADKRFAYTSPQISEQVGGYLLEKFPHLRVDVHNPELTVRVEIRENSAYVHGNALPGAGGLPVGTGGKAAVLISGGIDSPVAAWMLARRGVELTAIHFASPPYTSERARLKVENLLEKVACYAGRINMITVGFTHAQEMIRDNCPEELFTIIMRRYMMRVATAIAQKEGCAALITGESLGQVASQTIGAIACTDAAAGMPVFRPLIGMDKSEIVEMAYRIDTFDISIQPYEDCCTIFTPKHPRTRPTLEMVEQGESGLPAQELVAECLENLEYTHIRA